MSRQDSEESVHAAFWATAGWTPEEGYPGLRDGASGIPTHLKGKGRKRIQDPNEGGTPPEEPDFSGCGLPRPGSSVNAFVPLTL